MSWSLHFLITGDERVALELKGLAFRAGDASPAFAVLAQQFEENEERWFSTKGSGTWPPLKDATKRRKAREGLPSDPLIGASERLIDSLTGTTSDSLRYFGDDTMAFGTTVEYARFHRYGTKKMLERNPLARTIMLEAQARETLSRYLTGPLGKRIRRSAGARKAGWWRQ